MADDREQAWLDYGRVKGIGMPPEECFNAGYDAAVARAERAEAMVAALREALEECAGDCEWWPGMDEPKYCIRHSERAPCPYTEALTVLADTEAAAKAHDQRMRLEAVREFAVWAAHDGPGDWAALDALRNYEALEADRG